MGSVNTYAAVVGKTLFSIGVDEAAEAWRAIRSIRADPPERISACLRGHRRDVFHMALEQSQQQFAAAAAIGYESRPLNLFYGLAQAGRAIAAASSRLGAAGTGNLEAWLPGGGHGLKFDTTVPNAERLLAAPVRAQTGRSDTFSRVSHALSSPVDFDEVAFGRLLAQVPEIFHEFRRTDLGPTTLQPNGIYGGNTLVFPAGWELQAPGAPTDTGSLDDLRAWIREYPALADFDIDHDGDDAPRKSQNMGHLWLVIPDPTALRWQDPYFMPAGAVTYRRSSAIFPKLGSSQSPSHPLMVWWMLLFALSMVSRYSPRDWSHLMSIRESRIASILEHLLDTALDAVPNLIAEALSSLNED